MNHLSLESKGTAVRLAKSIRIITRQIIESEEARVHIAISKNDIPSPTISQMDRLGKEIDVMLRRRTFLIESLIGYLSEDSFTVDYIDISKRQDMDKHAILPISGNMRNCKKLYLAKVIEDNKRKGA